MNIEKIVDLRVIKDLVANDSATGFYDIPDHVYHASPGLSQSKMYDLSISPWHYKKFCERPKEQTDEMKFGTMVHMAVFEPDKFDQTYYVKKLQKDFGVSADGKKAYKEWVSSVEGMESVTQLRMDRAKEMRDALHAHDMFCTLCEGAAFEVAAYAKIQEIWCRGKADIVNPDLGIIADLKTTTDVSAHGFSATVEGGYNVQAAHYLDLFNRIQPEIADAFVFVAIEKKYPYAIQIFAADDDVLKAGYRKRNKLLSTFKECRDTNRWPGYPCDIQNLTRPTWAKDI